MKSITIAGNLAREWESADYGDRKVFRNSIAVNSKKKIDGEWQKQVLFFNVSAWGRRGEVLDEFTKKGHFLVVSGDFDMDTYEKKDGTTGISLRVEMKDFTFGPSRKSDDGGSGQFGSKPDTAPSGSFWNDAPF